MSIRLKIRKHDADHIILEALEGATHYGFGTFLEKLQPEEVDCDSFSKDAILRASYIHGLAGLEVFTTSLLAWGSPHSEVIMPISEISKQDGAEDWVSKIKVRD